MKPLNLFTIQPFASKNSKFFWDAINNVCKEFNSHFEVIRADKKPSDAGTRLQDRIDSYIKKSDLCIADMTGERNENVLLEVGAALCLNKPIIIVADKKLPSDISNQTYINLDASSLDKEETKKSFKLHLTERLTEILYSKNKFRQNQFIVYGFENRRLLDFFDIVKRCQTRINILTTNLGFVVNEELRCGIAPQKKTLLSIIADEIVNKPSSFSIKILTLDPDSNYTNERASALSRDRQEFREHMRADLNTVKNFVKSDDCKASVEIKTYDAFPLQMTYFFDDIVISSVVNNSKSSRECITYLHSLDESGVADTYVQHFSNLWAGAGTKSIAKSKKHAPRKNDWK